MFGGLGDHPVEFAFLNVGNAEGPTQLRKVPMVGGDHNDLALGFEDAGKFGSVAGGEHHGDGIHASVPNGQAGPHVGHHGTNPGVADGQELRGVGGHVDADAAGTGHGIEHVGQVIAGAGTHLGNHGLGIIRQPNIIEHILYSGGDGFDEWGEMPMR